MPTFHFRHFIHAVIAACARQALPLRANVISCRQSATRIAGIHDTTRLYQERIASQRKQPLFPAARSELACLRRFRRLGRLHFDRHEVQLTGQKLPGVFDTIDPQDCSRSQV